MKAELHRHGFVMSHLIAMMGGAVGVTHTDNGADADESGNAGTDQYFCCFLHCIYPSNCFDDGKIGAPSGKCVSGYMRIGRKVWLSVGLIQFVTKFLSKEVGSAVAHHNGNFTAYIGR